VAAFLEIFLKTDQAQHQEAILGEVEKFAGVDQHRVSVEQFRRERFIRP
jgi:hypothetical protein